MEFIALAISKTETKVSIEELKLKAMNFDLKLIIQEDSEIDTVVQEGVLSYINSKNLMLIQFVKLSEKFINCSFTSSGVSQNLIEYYFGKSNSILLDFMNDCQNLLPDNYNLIFAFDWRKNEAVRYQEMNINQLIEYFRTNNSWYFWLYDYLHDFYKPDLYIPLIIEVKNI